jgi:hypothetical protein
MIVYLSGPGAGRDGFTIQQNALAARTVYFKLIAAGVNCFCPHLSMLCQESFDIDYERWLAYDFAIIDVCTHVLMLPRWETSPGACRELKYAEQLGKIVLYDMEELH